MSKQVIVVVQSVIQYSKVNAKREEHCLHSIWKFHAWKGSHFSSNEIKIVYVLLYRFQLTIKSPQISKRPNPCVWWMSQHVWMKYIQLIIYIGFLNLGDSLPLIMYLFISITYENQKNKNAKNIIKSRCLVAHVCLRCTLKLPSIRDCSKFPIPFFSHPFSP